MYCFVVFEFQVVFSKNKFAHDFISFDNFFVHKLQQCFQTSDVQTIIYEIAAVSLSSLCDITLQTDCTCYTETGYAHAVPSLTTFCEN